MNYSGSVLKKDNGMEQPNSNRRTLNSVKGGTIAVVGLSILLLGGLGGWFIRANQQPNQPTTAVNKKSAFLVSQQSEGTEASPFGGHVHALAVNPATDELFLGARPIYRSRDGGKSWTAIDNITNSEERANVTSIVIDPQNPQVMYATGHGLAVIKSIDGGTTWEAKDRGLSGNSVEALAIDVNDSSQIYAWVLKDGLYRSADAGESWQRVSDGPKDQEIRSLASVGYPTGMGGIWLYAGLDTGIVKSPDCFCGWDKLPNVGLPVNKRVYSVAADPKNFKTLYAGTQEGVFKTEDAGENWRLIKEGVTDAVVAVNPSNSQHIYAVSSDGNLWSSLDAGNVWKTIEK